VRTWSSNLQALVTESTLRQAESVAVYSAWCRRGSSRARARRCGLVESVLRVRTCRACARPFGICPSCDRGHIYCSPACRGEARRACGRAARRRHQHSPEGRLDHRDHQRAYRARRRV